MGGFDQLWNLGDMVGYGARPNEVLDLLRPLATINVRGNHDRVCCGLTSSQGFNPIAAEAAAWTQRHLTIANLEWLRRAAGSHPRHGARLCAHGSPLHEDHYIDSMRDAWMPLQRMETEIAFFGHTHVQGGFSQSGQEWEEVRPATPLRRLVAQQGSVGALLLEVPPGRGTSSIRARWASRATTTGARPSPSMTIPPSR